MMPEAGGEYAFVRAAYGRFWAFVFGWMRFFIAGAGGARRWQRASPSSATSSLAERWRRTTRASGA